MTEPLQAAVEDLRRRITEKVAELQSHTAMTEILKWLPALNALEVGLGQSCTTLGQLFAFAETVDQPKPRVRHDEFFGLAALDAAKRYLRKGSDARPFDEIVAAIKAGGGKVEDEEALRLGLSRSTLDVVKIGGQHYGLLEHYPHVKRGGSKKRKTALTDAPESSEETDSADHPQGGK